MSTYYVDGDVGNDSNTGTSTGSGNAWLTVSKLLSSLGNGDIGYVKARTSSGVYSISTGLTASTGSGAVSYGTRTRVVGYTTTPGDGGQATIKSTAGITMLTVSGYGWGFENLTFDANSVASTTGISITGLYGNVVQNCIVKNCANEGFITASNVIFSLLDSEVTGCGGTNGAVAVASNSYGSFILNCNIHGNTKTGIYAVSSISPVIGFCTIYGNTGGGSCGIYFTGYPVGVTNCTIHGNASDGIFMNSNNIATGIRDCIFTGNGGYGLNNPWSILARTDPGIDYNWFGSGGLANTSGPRNSLLSAGTHDQSGDPQYANAASGDFTPGNSAVMSSSRNNIYIGSVQPAAAAGTGPVGRSVVVGPAVGRSSLF